jgi:hypothetical protein
MTTVCQEGWGLFLILLVLRRRRRPRLFILGGWHDPIHPTETADDENDDDEEDWSKRAKRLALPRSLKIPESLGLGKSRVLSPTGLERLAQGLPWEPGTSCLDWSLAITAAC